MYFSVLKLKILIRILKKCKLPSIGDTSHNENTSLALAGSDRSWSSCNINSMSSWTVAWEGFSDSTQRTTLFINMTQMSSSTN